MEEKEEIITDEDAQKINMERKRRIEARNRRKRKQQNKCKLLVFLFILTIAVIIFSVIYALYPKKTVSSNTICRDFTNKTYILPKLPEEQRLIAWDSELPNIIKNDIKEAKKKGYNIRYAIGNSVLCITFDKNGDPVLEGNSNYSWALSSFNTLKNFSIYQKDNALYLYGYNPEYGNFFKEEIFYSDYDTYPTDKSLTYDTNMPLTHKSKGIGTIKFDTCSLYYDEDTQTFSFYSKGKVISSKIFSDTVDYINIYNGVIITKNHMLYHIYTYIKDGVPDIKFVYVADGVELVESTKSYYSTAHLVTKDMESSDIPIFKVKDEYYVTIPNNWEDYNKYSLSNAKLNVYDRKTDYDLTLINLKDSFVSAQFDYKYSEWNIVISFNINGKIYTTDEYLFYGYDTRISLSNDDVEKLSIKVSSIEELEQQVQTIRDVYESYY